jgi:hypothetical protein
MTGAGWGDGAYRVEFTLEILQRRERVMRKIFGFALLVLLASGLIAVSAGCGSDDESSEDQIEQEADQAEDKVDKKGDQAEDKLDKKGDQLEK